MWFYSLSYASGPGYADHVKLTGGRQNPQGKKYMDPQFRQPATIPEDEQTHGGEDVPVYANGPFSHVSKFDFDSSCQHLKTISTDFHGSLRAKLYCTRCHVCILFGTRRSFEKMRCCCCCVNEKHMFHDTRFDSFKF